MNDDVASACFGELNQHIASLKREHEATISALRQSLADQDAEIQRLRAEVQRLRGVRAQEESDFHTLQDDLAEALAALDIVIGERDEANAKIDAAVTL